MSSPKPFFSSAPVLIQESLSNWTALSKVRGSLNCWFFHCLSYARSDGALGLAWLGLAWLGLAWLGLAWRLDVFLSNCR
jgi:hypothetical protein